MNNELIRYANRSLPVPFADRAVAREAKRIYDETRLDSLKADGVMAFAGHAMEGLMTLDAHRRALSNGDPVTDIMLTEIQANAVRAIGSIQRNLFNAWGL